MLTTLKSKVITSFIVLVILPVLVSAIIIVAELKYTQKNQVDLIQTQMTTRVASEFSNYIKFHVAQIRQMIELQDMPFGDKKAMQDKLLAQIMFNNNFDQIMLLDKKNGEQVVQVHRYHLVPENSKKTSYVSKIEYLFPKLNNSIFFGDITFIEETGEPISNISFDIRNPQTNSLMGVLIISLRLKPIWNLLADIPTQPGQSVYILDSENRLVAHPNPSLVLKKNTTHVLPTENIGMGLNDEESYITYKKNQFRQPVLHHRNRAEHTGCVSPHQLHKHGSICCCGLCNTDEYISGHIQHKVFCKPYKSLSKCRQRDRNRQP